MKKIITSVAVILCVLFSAKAQYYQLSLIGIGQNPNGLNTDIEDPATSVGWTNILTTSSTPKWSGSRLINFPFSFNGVAVTKFKVSSSGVLTFSTTTATPLPSSTPDTLPSNQIPDNSICVWGLQATGTDDKIKVKWFGSAPNRQLWIQFNSFSASTIQSGNTYWSIVLEETTNAIYIVDQRTICTTSSGNPCSGNTALTLGIQFDSLTALMVSGSPAIASTTNTTSVANKTFSDNTYYEFVYGTPLTRDAALTKVGINNVNNAQLLVPATGNVTGEFMNRGSDVIDTIVINYEYASTVYSDTLTGLGIGINQTYQFSHSDTQNLTAPGKYDAHVWLDFLGDTVHTNDSLNAGVFGMSFFPTKRVVIEEGTGTWCGWCPRGTVAMYDLRNMYPNTAMLVAIHNGDPMQNSVYAGGVTALVAGYPSGLVDRKIIDIDPTEFFDAYDVLINEKPPFDINVIADYNQVTKVLTAKIEAVLATDVTGNFRFNAVVVEEAVTGTGDGTNANGNDFDQQNYYNRVLNPSAPTLIGAGRNWNTSPHPIPATQIQYDHVGRAILGGFNGLAGSLPTNLLADSTYSHTFTYGLPGTWKPQNIYVIGWVSNGTTNEIINANKSDLVVGIDEQVAKNFNVMVYPNPMNSSNGQLYLNLKQNADVQVDVLDMMGRIVFSNNQIKLQQGEYVYPLNMEGLSNGIYNVRVLVDGEQITRRFVLGQ